MNSKPMQNGNGVANAQLRADMVNNHLPQCFNGYSVVPNFFAATDLFSSSIKNLKSEKCENLAIQMEDRNYKIYYSGDRLNQSDLNVWLRIAALYSLGNNKIGENVWLYLHEFLSQTYQSSVPRHAYVDLEETIIRLYSAKIVLVRKGKPPFLCRLISDRTPVFMGKGNKKTIELSIDCTIRDALEDEGFSFINMSERRELGNNQLALWLQLYYSRHADPFPISVNFFYGKAGTSATNITRWVRCTLKPAIERINKLNGWELFLDTQGPVSKLHCKQKPKLGKLLKGSAM